MRTLLVLIFFFPLLANAQVPGDSASTLGTTHLHEDPDSPDAEFTLKDGVPVKVLDKKNNWYKISAGDRTGWAYFVNVSSDVPTETTEERRLRLRQDSIRRANTTREDTLEMLREERRQRYIEGDSASTDAVPVTVRESPSIWSDVKFQRTEGTHVRVLDTKGDWHKISVGEKVGWAYHASLYPVAVRERPSTSSDIKFRLGDGVPIRVITNKTIWSKISVRERVGWVYSGSISSSELPTETPQERIDRIRTDSIRTAEAEIRQQRRRQYMENLRQRGYTIALQRYNLHVNTADGVSLSLGFRNVSDSKTIKYVEVDWKLFNPVGDPVQGEMSGHSDSQTRFVGPLKPGDTASARWENVMYSPVAECAEVRKIIVHHIDGSKFTYLSDLSKINEYSNANLMGDCAYEE